jgi:hypothetical protein
MKVRQTKEKVLTSVLVVDSDRLAGQAQEAQFPEVVKIAGVLEGCNTVAEKQSFSIFCLSRACLGKLMIGFNKKGLEKDRSRT